MREGTLSIGGNGVKVNFGTPLLKLVDTIKEYSFCPITFKLIMLVVNY